MNRIVGAAVAAGLLVTPTIAKADVFSDEVLLALSGLSTTVAVAKEGGEGVLSDEILLALAALSAGLAVIVGQDDETPASP